MLKGCDFDVIALVTNNTSVDKECRLVFGSRAVSYNGILGETCGYKNLINVKLSPGGGKCECVCVWSCLTLFKEKTRTM